MRFVIFGASAQLPVVTPVQERKQQCGKSLVRYTRKNRTPSESFIPIGLSQTRFLAGRVRRAGAFRQENALGCPPPVCRCEWPLSDRAFWAFLAGMSPDGFHLRAGVNPAAIVPQAGSCY